METWGHVDPGMGLPVFCASTLGCRWAFLTYEDTNLEILGWISVHCNSPGHISISRESQAGVPELEQKFLKFPEHLTSKAEVCGQVQAACTFLSQIKQMSAAIKQDNVLLSFVTPLM